MKVTNTQKQVMQLSLEGITYRDIAERLGLSYNTIRNTMHQLFVTNGFGSIVQAVAVAIKEGVITLDEVQTTPHIS